MKAGLIFIAACLAAATAQPQHHHRHQHQAKRQDVDVMTDVVTDVVTATQPAAIVFVDQNGNPVSTSFEGQPAATEAPPSSSPSSFAAPPSSSSVPPPMPASSSVWNSPVAPAAESTTRAPAPSPYSASSTSAQSPAPSPSNSGSGSTPGAFGRGISYDPYTVGACKTQEQIDNDFDVFSSDGYGLVRIYGTDCNQVSTVMNAATKRNMKLFVGTYDIFDTASEVDTIIGAVQNQWDAIDTVSIGNEIVNDGIADSSYVAGQVNMARGMLRAAGYTGPVVTVDVYSVFLDQSMAGYELCNASDYVAANCHAFFTAENTAAMAGGFVQTQVANLEKTCPGKDVVITESGWPSSGSANGNAVPSPENQRTAISSLKSAFSSNIVLFEVFNDLWKTNWPGTFDAEQYWGIYGDAPSNG